MSIQNKRSQEIATGIKRVGSKIERRTQENQTEVPGSKVPDVLYVAERKLFDVIRFIQAQDTLVHGSHGLSHNPVSHGHGGKSDGFFS